MIIIVLGLVLFYLEYIELTYFKGTCIGEKNHLVFYFFLLFQGIEVLYGEKMLIQRVYQTYDQGWDFEAVWRVIVLLVTTFFTVMVGSLFLFHSYLATQNLTTCNLIFGKTNFLTKFIRGIPQLE